MNHFYRSKDGQKLEMAAGEGGVMQLKDREAVTFTHNSGANVHALNVRKPKVTDVGNYVCSSVGSEDVESEKFNVLSMFWDVSCVDHSNISRIPTYRVART